MGCTKNVSYTKWTDEMAQQIYQSMYDKQDDLTHCVTSSTDVNTMTVSLTAELKSITDFYCTKYFLRTRNVILAKTLLVTTLTVKGHTNPGLMRNA